MKKVSKLARNEAPPKKSYSRLAFNLVPAGCRMDSMEGRDYLVVPMVMLTEGVHQGSLGPLYYPKDELSKTPVVWNHKPIVVYHPTMNGEGISACDPTVIDSRKVGVMMNTRWEGDKLKSEAWLEKERANKVDERIMSAVDAKEMMELSTGVFVDVEPEEGEWKGEKYSGIARNYRPDHLALLPDQIGACSIKDGAGFLRNQAQGDSADAKALKKVLVRMGLLSNEMSFSNISDSLRTALQKKYNADPAAGNYIWVCDVYSNFVIYEWQGKLYRLGYSGGESGITLSEDEPTEVVRVTEYRTINGAYVGNQNQNHQEQTMNKKETVDAIIATKDSVWKEGDRPTLMAMNEDQLKLIHQGTIKPAPKTEPASSPAGSPGNTPTTQPATNAAQPAGTPAAPEAKKAATLNEYVAAAPKEIQDVLTNSIGVYNEEKQKLIDIILANENNSFTKEDLATRPLGELKSLARLAAKKDEAGKSAPYFGGQAPAANQGAEEALEVPVMNFAKA